MSRFKGAKLRSVPLSFATFQMDPFADNGVTELMIEHWSYPPTRGWFKELSGYHDPVLPDVARR